MLTQTLRCVECLTKENLIEPEPAFGCSLLARPSYRLLFFPTRAQKHMAPVSLRFYTRVHIYYYYAAFTRMHSLHMDHVVFFCSSYFFSVPQFAFSQAFLFSRKLSDISAVQDKATTGYRLTFSREENIATWPVLARRAHPSQQNLFISP